MHIAHCVSSFLDYNAHRRKTRKKETTMSKKSKRTFMQKIHDMIEDGVYAFAMCYAKDNLESVRMFEEKLR